MKEKILIADDDQDFVAEARSRLEAAGYVVICAHEAVRAIEMAHKERPNIILLDWKMPTGRGGDVLESLSKKDETRKIPVLVVTAAEEPSMSEKSKIFKVKDVIFKPVNYKILFQKIHEALQWKRYEDSLTQE